jgi:hypothetical protein
MHAIAARLRPLMFTATAVAAASALMFIGAGSATAGVVTEDLAFAPGSDKIFLYGHVNPGDAHVYRLDAHRGQVMIAEADPYWAGFVLTVDGPTGTLASDQQWSKLTLPADGSYRITVHSTRKSHGDKDYGLSVTIVGNPRSPSSAY